MTGPLTPTFKINEITSISSISNRHLNDVEDLLKKLQEKATKESSYSDNFDELIDQSFESLMNNEKYNEKNVLHKWLKEEIYSVIDLLNEGDENLIKEQQASLKDKIGPQNAFSVLAHAYQLACTFKKNATEGEFDHVIIQLDKALKELAAEVTNVYKPTNTKLIFDSNTVNPEFLKQLQASEAKLKRLIYCGLASIAALGTLWVIYSKLNQPVDLVEDNSNPAKENINAEPKESKKPVFDDHLTVNKSLQNSSSNAADRIKLEEIISNNWTEQNTPPIKNISAPIFTTGIANSEINETNLSLFDAPPPNNADALPLNSSSNTIDGVELEKETISNTSLIKNESAAIFTTNTADLEHNETNLYLFDDPLTNNANTVNSSVELEETISNDLPQQNTSTESIKDASSSIPNRTVERSVSQLNQDYNTFSNGNWRYQTPITEIQNPNVQKNNEQQPKG